MLNPRKLRKNEASLDLTSDYGRLYDEVGDPEDIAIEIGNKVVNVLKRIYDHIEDAVNNSYSEEEFLTNLQFLLDGIRGDYSKKYPLDRLYNLAGGAAYWDETNPWIRDYSKKFIDVVYKGAGHLFDDFSIHEEKNEPSQSNPSPKSWVWLIATEKFEVLRGHNNEDMDTNDLIDVAHLIADRVEGKGWETGHTYITHQDFTIKSSGWNLGGMVLHFLKYRPELQITIYAG